MLLENPLLRAEKLEERAYQLNVARSCLERSTLIVLPTGMGKTVVALLVVAEVLRREAGRVLFMAPTKPLVEQHAAFLRAHLKAEVGVLTGEVPPPDREWTWRSDDVVVATPQVVRNDLRRGLVDLEGFGLLVFDEAHRAVGDYAYVDVGAAYKRVGGRVLGMTASPGSDPDKILEVCQNIGIEGVEIRTDTDPDVVPYLHDVRVDRVGVDLPENVRQIRDLLRSAFEAVVAGLRERGFLAERRRAGVREIVAAQKQIQRRLQRGERNYHLYQALSRLAMALKLNHAIEVLETQGLGALKSYMEKLEEEAKDEEGTKASRTLLKTPKVQEAFKRARVVKPEDPKVAKVLEVVRGQLARKPDARVIVFSNYRERADLLVRAIDEIEGAKPFRFVGQADRAGDRGLSQKEQVDLVERFKAGEFNVMVATSVAEEGLDIPSTDLVVFHEPVPSEIRTIQRRGRTGRNRPGRVVVVVTKDSRDEAYLHSAHRKERKMHEELERLREKLKQRILVGKPGGGLFRRADVPADVRESSSPGEEDFQRERDSRRKQSSLAEYE